MTTASRPDAHDRAAYAPPAEGARCLDCGTALVGHFCHACGARRADERPLTVARFAHELAHEVTSVDSATVSTMRALFLAPGRMTADYLAGHARRYLSPLRVYVLLFGLMMAFSNATGISERIRQQALSQLTARQQTKLDRFASQGRDALGRVRAPRRDVAGEIMTKIFKYSFSPWLRLLDPLAIAGLLAVLYRGRRRSYAEHFVFALHVLAFNAALTVVTMSLHAAVDWKRPLDAAVTPLHWLVIGTYFFVASRVVHSEPRGRTAVKSLAFVAGAQLAMMMVPMLVATVAVVQALLL